MQRRIDRYPLLADVLRDTTTANAMRGILDAVGITDIEFRNHFRRRRINAPALIDGAISSEAVAEWLADMQDAAAVALDGVPALKEAYNATLAGALSDNGRREQRTVYAAPNGIAPAPGDSHVTGSEVLDVTGEYAEGAEHLEKFADVRTFKELLLSRFEPCFLGVISEW